MLAVNFATRSPVFIRRQIKQVYRGMATEGTKTTWKRKDGEEVPGLAFGERELRL